VEDGQESGGALAARDDGVAGASGLEDEGGARAGRRLAQERGALWRADLLVRDHRHRERHAVEEPAVGERLDREGHHDEAALHVHDARTTREPAVHAVARERRGREHGVVVADQDDAAVVRGARPVEEQVVPEARARRHLGAEGKGAQQHVAHPVAPGLVARVRRDLHELAEQGLHGLSYRGQPGSCPPTIGGP
jgi:hypothetical protein